MKRVLIIIALSLFSLGTFAQETAYLGIGGYNNDYVYEDGLTDSGIRYIYSDSRYWYGCHFCVCKFVPENEKPWYGIAIESAAYIPKNGLLVFVCENQPGESHAFVLGKVFSDKAMGTTPSMPIIPLSGGNGSYRFATYGTTVKNTFYAVFDIPEEELLQLIDSNYRVSSVWTFNL